MKFIDVIRSRRSVRKFKSDPISDNIINELIESARLAPSGGNSQNHVFGIIRDESLRKQLAEAAGKQMWIASAPVIIAGCSDISWDIANQPGDDFGVIVNNLRFGNSFMEDMKKYPNRRAFLKLHHNSSPCIAMEHIFLTAVSHGLNACFVGHLDIDNASEILGLPKNLACLFLLPVGYADEFPIDKELKSVDEISFYDKWTV
ncbi:MAG: nitroreductase family protein [Defluviitaleaceae bacterium]|nr:nitroreductase family protein [Defluviitaleaceae bacterium]